MLFHIPPTTSGNNVPQNGANNSPLELKNVNKQSCSNHQLILSASSQLIEDTSFTNSAQPDLAADSAKQQLMRHALLNILLVNRRRRHSWPRCKLDNLQFHNFNREVRLFCHRNQPQNKSNKVNFKNNDNNNNNNNSNCGKKDQPFLVADFDQIALFKSDNSLKD